MQALTLEVGFSETTFVLPAEAGGHARIRTVNPPHELPFAGRPVLGTAFVLAAPLQLGLITLETGMGPVDIALERDDSGRISFGRMEQPLPEVRPVEDTDALFETLGVAGSELPVLLYDNGATHIFVTLESESALAALAQEASGMAQYGVRDVH